MKRAGFVMGVVLLLGAAAAAWAYDRGQFLFLDEIRVGMTGVGKTIVSGDTISEFAVEVLGVVDEPGEASDFVVVRVSGEAIGRSGGIAQGMSGSPIYVDGKLIGALSRAAAWSKELTPIGLVTPIEEMLGLIDETRTLVAGEGQGPVAGLPGVHVVELESAPGKTVVDAIPEAIFAYPVSTPILVSGLSGRSLEMLMSGVSTSEAPAGLLAEVLSARVGPSLVGLRSRGLELLPLSGGARSGPGASSLVPGGAMGIALATGDISVGALGTVTFREGETLVGFGHPFLANGVGAFPLTSASVIDTMRTYDAPFKLGTLGPTVGSITVDRAPGVGGVVGGQARLIDLELSIRDGEKAPSRAFRVSVVDEARLLPDLLLASGCEAIDQTLNRIGQGTVDVTYRIAGDGLPREVVRRDLFLSAEDVALYPPWQLAELVSFLQYNPFGDPKIRRIAAEMTVTQDLRAIQINHLEVDQQIYEPGDTVRYRVVLQTWRGEVQEVEGSLEIPDDVFADYVVVRAYSGPRPPESGESAPEFADLSELVDAIEELPSYDQLTVELFAPNLYAPGYDALAGIDKVETRFEGQFLYDERQVTALIHLPG